MNRSGYYCLIIILLFFTKFIEAQRPVEKSELDKPKWISGDFPKKANNSFYFKIGFGEGNYLSEAKENSIASLVLELANDKGVSVSGKSIHEINTKSIDGEYSENEKYHNKFEIKTDNFSTVFEKVDEYWESYRNSSGSVEYRCWTLFQVAKDPDNYSFEKINFTTNYGFAPVWRSALVPGWGQLYKKQKTKGLIILSSEAILIAGGLTSEYLRSSYYNKALDTKDIQKRRDYLSKSDTWEIGRNVLFVVAGGVYIYNLVDVLTSKGAKKYADNKSIDLGIKPIGDTYCFSLTYKF